MGFFDSIAKQALGGLLGGGSASGINFSSLMSLFANQDKVAEAVSGLLSETGGINGLLQKFQDSGLRDAVSSWVGTGENQNVSADQVRDALGGDTVEHFAGKIGLNAGQILPVLAQFLPIIIDQLTPNGTVDDNTPSADRLKQVMTGIIQRVMSGK